MVLVRVIALVVVLHLLGAGWRMVQMLTASGWPYLRIWTTAGWGKLRKWWRLQTWALGGVRTLGHALRNRCMVCRERMEAGAVVRTLSCDHAFHKACIDWRLRENDMACPVCGRTARWVPPWKPLPERLRENDPRRGRGGVSSLDCIFHQLGAGWAAGSRALRMWTTTGWWKLRMWALGGASIDCSMCQYRLEASDDIRRLSCGHVFHKDCDYSIEKWLRANNMTCPICRQPDRGVPP